MKVSIYSDLSDAELEVLHEEYTAKYGAALVDESKSPEERRLVTLVESAVDPDKQEEELLSAREFVKEYVFRQLKELAMIIYLAMQKRNDFGFQGEQQVTISFLRNILGIPNNSAVTPLDADRFQRIVNDYDNRNGNKTGDEYLAYTKDGAFVLLGKKRPYHSISKIQDLLSILGADYFIIATHDTYGTQFIFADYKVLKFDGCSAYMLQHEYIRSPQFTLATAAINYGDGMVVRRESCAVIFFNKYQRFMEDYFIGVFQKTPINSEINNKLREKVLQLFDMAIPFDPESIAKSRDSVIQEMEDGILWNQIGVLVYYEDMEPIHLAFKNNLVNGEGIGPVFTSLLADWAPERGKRKGAIVRFCEIAEFDVKRATRDVFMYMSDNWYVSDEEYMALMSDITVGLILSFFCPDGTIDFDRLSKESHAIYELVKNRFKVLIDGLLAVIYKSRYQMGVHNIDYPALEDEIFKMYQESTNARPIEELRVFPPFWVNMVAELKEYSKEGWEEYQALLAVEAVNFERLVLDLITQGKGDARHNSMRHYIVSRFREIGIIEEACEQ